VNAIKPISISLGVALHDLLHLEQDHQHLADLRRRVKTHIVDSVQSSVDVCNLLTQLAEYVAEHFTLEEEIMRRMHYPHIDEHKEEHWRVTQRLTEVVYDFEIGKDGILDEVVSFLDQWLEIQSTCMDRKLLAYLQAELGLTTIVDA